MVHGTFKFLIASVSISFSFSLFGFFAFDARRTPSKLNAQFHSDHFPAQVTLMIG